jgi:hypothetical protein
VVLAGPTYGLINLITPFFSKMNKRSSPQLASVVTRVKPVPTSFNVNAGIWAKAEKLNSNPEIAERKFLFIIKLSGSINC